MDEGALVDLHQLHLGELDDFGVGQHLSADVSIGTGDECPSLYGPTPPLDRSREVGAQLIDEALHVLVTIRPGGRTGVFAKETSV